MALTKLPGSFEGFQYLFWYKIKYCRHRFRQRWNRHKNDTSLVNVVKRHFDFRLQLTSNENVCLKTIPLNKIVEAQK